jgi:flagellar motor switch protein FliM
MEMSIMQSQLDESAALGAPVPANPAECRPELLLGDQLELARQTFVKSLDGLAALIPGYLFTAAEIQFTDTNQRILSEALSEGENEGCVVVLGLDPFPGCAYLVLGRSFVCSALEILLGTPAEAPRFPRESLTAIDLHILQGLFEAVAGELRKTWQPMCGSSFRYLSADLTGQSASVELDEQSAVVLTAEITMRGCAGTLRMIIPSLLIRLASQPAREYTAPDPETSRAALLSALGSAAFEVEAVLRGGDIRIRDLLELKPGLILELPQKAPAPVECLVNGVVKFRGELVNRGKSVGFEVQSWAAPEGQEAPPPD